MRVPLTNYSTWMSTRAAPDPLQHAREKSFSKQKGKKTVISPHAVQAGSSKKLGSLIFLRK